MARPLFRERHSPEMSEEDATKLLHEGLRVSTVPSAALLACILITTEATRSLGP